MASALLGFNFSLTYMSPFWPRERVDDDSPSFSAAAIVCQLFFSHFFSFFFVVDVVPVCRLSACFHRLRHFTCSRPLKKKTKKNSFQFKVPAVCIRGSTLAIFGNVFKFHSEIFSSNFYFDLKSNNVWYLASPRPVKFCEEIW